MEDVGYETAHIKGADVIGQLCTMLRQRGMRVVQVYGFECDMPPLDHVPDGEEVLAAEREAARLMARWAAQGGAAAGNGAANPAAPASSAPTTSSGITTIAPPEDRPCVVAEEVPDPPHGSVALAHRQRGLGVTGEQVWAFLLPGSKVGVKQVRAVHAIVSAKTTQSTEEDQQESAAEFTTSLSAAGFTTSLSPPRLPLVRRVILVARDRMPDASVEFMRGEVLPERFLLQELTYNLTRHYLVPPHRVLDTAEVAALKKKFPKLAMQSRDDALSRFYGMAPGDVVSYRRQRLGGLGGIYYREVC